VSVPEVGAGSVAFHFTVTGEASRKPSGSGVVIETAGGTESTFQVLEAGEGSGVPFAIASTENVCTPWARPVGEAPSPPDSHGANGAPSSEHWNVDVSIVEENVNVADVDATHAPAVGPDRMAVSGTVDVTDHARESGVGSWFPAASVARTANVWPVGARFEYDAGLEHAANAAPSSEHWNVDAGSVEVNENCAVVDVVVSGGPSVIVVSI
jgi:hypothetical protein